MVAGDKTPWPGTEEFSLDEGQDELLKGQSVITEEAGHGYRRGQ